MAEHPLRAMLEDAARGRFPAADGSVDVLPSTGGHADAVVAFTGRHVVAADIDEADVLRHVPAGDLGAPLSPGFLSWLGSTLGCTPGGLDVVLAAIAPGEPSVGGTALTPASGSTHDRVVRSRDYRDDVEVYTAFDGAAVVILGRGLVGRREVAIELAAPLRGKGAGRAILAAALSRSERGEGLFAQIAPGNAASIRTFLSVGFRPIGSEVLFRRSAPSATRHRPPEG